MIVAIGALSFILAVHAGNPFHQDDNLLFVKNVADYETTLTADDFRKGQSLMESQLAPPEADMWDSDAMYSRNRFEGDIANANLSATTIKYFLNGGVTESGNGNFYNAIKNRHQLWPNGRIPYTISSQYSSYSRSLIAASMQEYSQHTCIKWVPKEANDNNYVHIYPDRGCYSMVGRMGGKQMLSLGSGCIQKGIIIHELMHAVGFFHEQSRTDRDDYITILWTNIQRGMEGQFEKYGHGTISDLGTKYDYTSIMHYGGKAFSKNGQPTMVPKQKDAQIGQRSGFSKVDIFKINTLYGCPTDGVETTTTTTTQQPITTTTMPSTPTPYTSTLVIVESCKNLRGDCDSLAANGWCTRNPGWMKENCPIACNFCKPNQPSTSTTTAIPVTAPPAPPLPPLPPLPPMPVTPDSQCEDLRVDCITLVKQRYCIKSGQFMKTYCAKSCGYCFQPPPTEVPDNTVTQAPTVLPRNKFVTFRPPIVSTQSPIQTSTLTLSTIKSSCVNKKHFCENWKAAGFCEGLFMGYMKKNCPAACGLC